MDSDHMERTFALMDEGMAIERRLASGFPELSFLYYADDVLRWMQRNRVLVAEALDIAASYEHTTAALWTRRIDVLFHFGNYLASAQSGIDFLYSYGKNGVFTAPLLSSTAARMDTLKKCTPQKVMTHLRNRLIHAPPLLDELFLRVRLKTHPEGEGRHICPVLTGRAISGIDGEIPSQGPVKELWDAIRRDNQARQDWLSPLLEKHRVEFESAFSDVKKVVEVAYQASVDEYRRLERRRDEIEAELVALGTTKLQ